MLVKPRRLFSASAFSAALPNEIFQPRGAQTVLADQKSSGGFAAEFSLQAGQNSVQALARPEYLVEIEAIAVIA